MKFSDTTNKDGILQDIEDLLVMDDGSITGNTTRLKRFTALVNLAYHKVVAWILEAQSNWEWDDTNYTDFPISTTDLVNNQQDYQLPGATSGANASTLLTILRVEALDAAGNYQKLQQFDEQQIHDLALSEFQETAGMPRYYREVGNSIELYPKPSSSAVTTTAGLRVYFQRTFDEFTTSDTTQQPGFAAPFHRLLSLEAGHDFASTRVGMEEIAASLKMKRDELKESLMKFYAYRNREVRTRIKPRPRAYN